MTEISMTVNGQAVSGAVEPRTLLVDFLRRELRLTGTHVGCDTSQCGACVVHVDGQVPQKHARMLAVQAEGADEMKTIEGVADGDTLPPDAGSVPRASRAAMRVLHAGHGDERARSGGRPIRVPGIKEIRAWLEGNLCRCTGYQNIVISIEAGIKAMK